MPGATTFDAASERQRQSIRTDISQHEHAITDLLAKLNTFAHTACLPDEMLFRVFLQFRDSHLPKPGHQPPTSQQPPFYGFIYVSHVSRHWRNLALGRPTLWNRIAILNNLECLHTMFERSKPTLVSIEAPPGRLNIGAFDVPRKAVAVVVKELHRIQSFTLDIPEGLYQEYSALFTSPAPCLHSINIRGFYTASTELRPYDSNPTLTSLERLSSSGFQVKTLYNLMLPSITEFTLFLPDRMGSWDGSASQELMAALAKLPSLLSLTLVNAAQGKQDAISKVSLPNLQSLHIVDSIRHTTWVLTCLQIPSTAAISIQSKHGRESKELKNLGSSIAANYKQGPPLVSYSIHFADVSSFLVIRGSELDIPGLDKSTTPAINTQRPLIQISISPFVVQGGLHHLFCTLPQSSTATLYLDGNLTRKPFALQASDFSPKSPALSKLRNLFLDNWHVEAITTLFSNRSEVPKCSCGTGMLGAAFSGLQKLVLRSPRFEAFEGTEGVKSCDRREEVAGLITVLKEREKHSGPIPVLVLESCDGRVAGVLKDRLSKTEIRWDGAEE